MPERKILLVERERYLSEAIEDFFSARGAQIRIVTAGSVREAIDIVRSSRIEMVVSDHYGSGDLDGLELVKVIRKAGMPIRVVLSSDASCQGDRTDALIHGCDNFVIKPHPIEDFCELLLNMLVPEQGYSGRLVGMKLEDVIQMFCFRKDSTLLSVSNGVTRGLICVHEGGIVHAECDSLSGVDAFYEILGWESGEFVSQVSLTVPARTVYVDWQSLLMEGIRQKDEIRHALGPATPFDAGEMPESEPGAVVSMQSASDAASRGKAGENRIMIVDDSRLIRKIVQEIVQSDSALSVAGYATNGQEALAKIDELRPDLILLDWDMPVMKGSTALMHIMIRSPCPVIVLSGFVGGVGANPFDLLCLGAVDFLRKPQSKWRTDGRADDLVRRIKQACEIKLERIRRVRNPSLLKASESEKKDRRPSRFLSVFGSGTGGCSDLIRIIPNLSPELPTALVFLHDMQQDAIGAFIDYLDQRSRIKVKAAEPGEVLEDGACYMHPSVVPLELVKEGGSLTLRALSEVPDYGVVDHFLISASKIVGPNLVAILLSGGPGQGVDGLRAVKQVEGTAVIQEPRTSVDPRMGEEALAEGVVDHQYSAEALAEEFQRLARNAQGM